MCLRTQSEALFEDYCARNGVRFERVPTGTSKTNDYDLFIGTTRIVCEVKQIDPNKEDRAWERDGTRRSPWPRNRVRNKIKAAVRQIRARGDGRFPSLLIIYNNVPGRPALVSGAVVLDARYGQEVAVVRVFEDVQHPPELDHMAFGGNRRVTPEQNTSLSAVAILERQHPFRELAITTTSRCPSVRS